MKIRFTDGHRFPVPYRKAVETDIRKTFDRRRRELADQVQRDEENRLEAAQKVQQLPKSKRKA